MRRHLLLMFLPFLVGCAAQPQSLNPAFAEFQASAANFDAVLEMPVFERTPAAVRTTVTRTLAQADLAFDLIAEQDPSVVSFDSSIKRFDDVIYPVMTVMNRLYLMKETQADAEMRQACTDAVSRLNEWTVQLAYREDLYKICQAFMNRYTRGALPKLSGEDLRLMQETMRDFRRDGMHLDAATRSRVADLKNKLNQLETDFDTNITEAQRVITFSTEELEGVSPAFLESSKTKDGQHRIRVTVTSDYLAVMQNASREATRKTCNQARYTVAMEENGPILNQMVATRDQIAHELEYANWADYQIEPKMAKNGATALAFVEDLIAGLQPKFEIEVEVLRQMKARHLEDNSVKINFWDFRYYQTQFMKSQFGVDPEALRQYFPLQQVLEGMFTAYERIFGLEFIRLEPNYKWVDDLQLYVVTEASSGEPLGMFYLDNFPREGKYNHFAQFDIIGGKKLRDGRYQRPVVSLVCNFTPAVGDAPPLMSHYEVETIFHEFGHAMHSILTRAKYARYAGANVARDFVEAPSQMFENWAWDPDVLGEFATNWQDPSQRIPAELIERMKEADLATKGIFYRRQLSLALGDLRLHMGGELDAQMVVNQASADALFAPIPGSNFAAYWGHLTGYDAGYYGYAWADSIAADMATAFQEAPGGYRDRTVGQRLRDQIYAVGGSVDPVDAVQNFLQRPPSNAAFLKSLGLQ
jgi:Zn-dependent oligopeptidase